MPGFGQARFDPEKDCEPGTTIAVVSEEWEMKSVARPDFDTIKAMFLKLHLFNASLDPRFTLSDQWETYFYQYMERALECHDTICILARRQDNQESAGFILATLNEESPMWKHRQWVEVVGLYLEKEERGRSLALNLLNPVYHWATSLGVNTVQLYVTATNNHAADFYERKGFVHTQSIMRKIIPNE